jgi:predicted nucleotidyltransferase
LSVVLTALYSVVSFLVEAGIEHMLVGGYALPFYGAIRLSLRMDIALAILTEGQFETFLTGAEEAGFTHVKGAYGEDALTLLDRETGLEVNLWTRPPGIDWSYEVLERRRRFRLDGFEAWVVSPEDFIVNKLTRTDRGVQDEADVKSVLARMDDELDWEYLRRKASTNGVWTVLTTIREM